MYAFRRPVSAICAALLAVAALLLTACSSGSTTSADVSGGGGNAFTYRSATAVGSLIPVQDRKKAQDVSGPLLSSPGTISLSKYKGKVLLMTFWASWCGPCQVETPQLSLLYQQDKNQGIDVLGVNTKNPTGGQARQFVKDNDIAFPSIYDPNAKVLLQLGNVPSAGLPVNVLIDKQQRVAAVYIARLADKQVQPALEKLRAES